MIRLAVLGMMHETNTFSSIPADLATYRSGGIRRGEEFFAHYIDSKATYAGFLAPSPGQDVEVVPLMDAVVTPRGSVTTEAFETIVDEMVGMLTASGPFDGVLLGLHGAGVAVGYPAMDAEIALRVRAVVGPDVPIGSVVDMHANIDQGLVDVLDVLLAYQTNPHVDPWIRAKECRRLILEIIASGKRPAMALEQLPLVVNITAQDTSTAPMNELLDIAGRIAASSGALDISVVEGFPYADVAHMGMSVLVVHEDAKAARKAAREVAAAVWDRRIELQGSSVTVDEAMDAILAHEGGRPLLVLDVGDNIGGGGPGDSTVILRAALERGVSGLASTLFDPDAVAALSSVAVGERARVTAGGHSAEQDGTPVEFEGTVIGRHSGLFEEPKIAHGGFRFFDGGDMVAITTDDGVSVVLTSQAVQTVTPVQLSVVGLDPASFRAIVGKGVNAPRAGYAEVCGELVVVDTPGVTRASVEGFTYLHRRSPMYPFEPQTTYAPAAD